MGPRKKKNDTELKSKQHLLNCQINIKEDQESNVARCRRRTVRPLFHGGRFRFAAFVQC